MADITCETLVAKIHDEHDVTTEIIVSPGLVMRGVFEILETTYSVTERPEYKINKAGN